MKKRKFDFDLIILGSGAGGAAAANIAAKNGLKVAIVENNIFGGESPNFCDIPKKTLLETTHILANAKYASKFGIRSNTIGYSFASMMRWKDSVIKRTGAHDNIDFYKNLGIETIRGKARFISPNEISVNHKHISSSKFIVATGSHFSVPDIANIKNVAYYTPNTVLNIQRPPKSIFIVGGSSEAVEIAQIFAVLGTKVYISEVSARLLPSEDEEVGITIENIMVEQMKVFVLPQTRVVSVEREGILKKVVFQRGGVEKFVRVDEIIIAGNRQPNTDIGLENAGVEYTDEGIVVNNFLQTSVKHIFATGSVLESRPDTTEALIQSRIAVHNILKPRNKLSPEVSAVPNTISTMPEIARVGLTEDDCIKRDLQIKTSIAPLSLIARSNIDYFSHGFVKLICDKHNRVIGGSIVAPEASSLIQEIALAVKYNLTASDLAETPHAFLSWSEAIRVAAHKIK